MTRIIHRHSIPVDGQAHTVELRGPILHVATRTDHHVEIWCLNDDGQPVTTHDLFVVGTGQPIPAELTNYFGTAITPSGRLVWHLFERERAGGTDG